MMAPLEMQDGHMEAEQPPTAILPPYNGYGSLEDSAENCKHLIPRPPKKDYNKLFQKSNIVLRFEAQLVSQTSGFASEDDRQAFRHSLAISRLGNTLLSKECREANNACKSSAEHRMR